MRLAIVGSRSFGVADIPKACVFIHSVISRHINIDDVTHIISGGADGADTVAAEYAAGVDHIEMVEHLPDINRFGVSAFNMRNTTIVDDCDVLFAFWDGKSGGTKDSIKQGIAQQKPIYVYNYNKHKVKKYNVQKPRVKLEWN